MPYITKYQDVEMDIEIEEFVDECTTGEINILIKYLKKEGHLNSDEFNANETLLDIEWAKIIKKISGNNRLRLSIEDEEIIRKIAKK
jgi:hypothetical protein